MQGADLQEAQLQGADLEGAQLQGAYLCEAQLQGANLEKAQLQGADLHSAQLQEAYLGEAMLEAVHVLERGVRPDGHEAKRVDDAVRGVDPADLWCHGTMCVTVQAAYGAQERAVCVSVHAHVNTTADSRVRAA